LKAKGDSGSDGRKSYSAKHLVGASGLVRFRPLVPGTGQLLDLSFWPRPGAMDGSDARVLWNAPYRRNSHALGNVGITAYYSQFVYFLRRRLLFGRVARFWTITIAILFIVLAAASGLTALITYAGSFL
jgi:hypothetical protein